MYDDNFEVVKLNDEELLEFFFETFNVAKKHKLAPTFIATFFESIQHGRNIQDSILFADMICDCYW